MRIPAGLHAHGVGQRWRCAARTGGHSSGADPGSAATRIRAIGSANWTLVAQDPGRTTLTAGYAKAVDAYNIFDTQYFAADLENDAVQRRLATALAEQITLQLATYFRKRAAASG